MNPSCFTTDLRDGIELKQYSKTQQNLQKTKPNQIKSKNKNKWFSNDKGAEETTKIRFYF